jgi:DNA-binding CsgD family transcriptional regulator
MVSELASHAKESRIPWNRAMAARSRALLAAARMEFESAIASADLALTEHTRQDMPFELARTLLIRGEIQRRAKRRAEANQSLRRAGELFETLGARGWADKARAETTRLGLRRSPTALTETERRVAELASAGMRNREIAASLFISPATVKANLARIYTKLGIRSRVRLGAHLRQDEQGALEPEQR